MAALSTFLDTLRLVAWLEKGIDQNTTDSPGVQHCGCGKRMLDKPLKELMECDHEQQDLPFNCLDGRVSA